MLVWWKIQVIHVDNLSKKGWKHKQISYGSEHLNMKNSKKPKNKNRAWGKFNNVQLEGRTVQ
jgi:hypothetical protein